MTELDGYIKGILRSHGPISVARFMHIALQHPDHGYYVAGDPLGKKGDFVTAPEISQMFGEMVGVWLAFMWKRLGKPDPFALLELGPGRGTLMADALRASAHVEGFHAAMRLYFMESNATFKALQSEKLAAYAPKHIAKLEELPDLPLCAVANEFFDAMPVHQYKKTHNEWREIMVALEGERFVFQDNETPTNLPLPDTLSFYEIAPDAVACARSLSQRIVAHSGAALIVDYGHDRPPDILSLQAVDSHKPCAPLDRPGKVDLSAHVDFGALALAARQEGAFVTPVAAQSDFLRALGLDIRADKLRKNATAAQAEALDAALFRLTDPLEMGALFKALAIVSDTPDDVPGFP